MTHKPRNLAYILSNEACCICGKLYEHVCQECLALGQLACFCDDHEERHRTERTHQALWGVLGS